MSLATAEALSPAERIARDLVDDAGTLVSPPDVCVRVNVLAGDPECSLGDIAAVVMRDPGLSAKVLRLANSAHYGYCSRVATVSRAVTLLGSAEIRKIVCAVCAVERFSGLSSAVTDMNSFWRHGVYTGLAAQAIARRAGVLHPERLFVAGLLHDVGTLLVNRRFPELAGRLITAAAGDEDALCSSEGRELGFDHAWLGGLMLAGWSLPPALVNAIRWHHAPWRARVARVDAAIVRVADRLANVSGTGAFSRWALAPDAGDAELFERHGLDVRCSVDALVDEVAPQFIETVYLLIG